ncbi:hypothetical protein PHYBLDRAFT_171827 [Phycomyces blakesleeanus NRRL 1555(-)]|uniref:Uncharacterized protein n=1 Tax=Phycomyces blakesleeanus (strain ATCC 8743b / DSM 1359 / FGSC 10004 / NBRC 33097 / NRRL 1555) TaxID=763407 RepID=A0A167L899_PHYB8|nr:hypothetical protein PHYBLDRAFT_171827 [Phycomyces blakesleeanus NRRL 1555(-)]OAD69809.1 hypothetical protein PHYBLDRAFT_171827 [Phycomyces blakesleeanus NRRL 1555(-)]|eukprot:XP_018287849.1 hypothetical protein PHYBLDRAFT_171827 [Phycomyces blakesleeanus NRRL 1555(-)]
MFRKNVWPSIVSHLWHVFVFFVLLMIFLLLAFMFQDHPMFHPLPQSIFEQVNYTHLAINETLYPVESNILRLFPEIMQSILLRVDSDYVLETDPWITYKSDEHDTDWESWVDQDGLEAQDSQLRYACKYQPLPFPILHHVVSSAVGVENNGSAFDRLPAVDKPFLILPFISNTTLKSDDTICVRVVVSQPAPDPSNPFQYLYRPNDYQNSRLVSPWWDTMMVTMQHNQTNATTTLSMQPWSGHMVLRKDRMARLLGGQAPGWYKDMEETIAERDLIHVYEADAKLKDIGEYHIQGLLEYQAGKWNFELGPVNPYEPQLLPVYPLGAEDIRVVKPGTEEEENEKVKKEERSVEQAQKDILDAHLALPLCHRADNLGRWLPVPLGYNTTLLAGIDHHNKVWAPYNCRYRKLSYDQFNRCLARRYPNGVDLYGDSNTRRSLKAMLSHGKWCDTQPGALSPNHRILNLEGARSWKSAGDDGQRRSCYCEDYTEPSWNNEWLNPHIRLNDLFFENTREESKALGRNTEWDNRTVVLDKVRLRSYKWDGLTYLNNPGWDTAFVPLFGDPSIRPDIVVFSLGNWDAAFLTLADFNRDLTRLIELIRLAYQQVGHPKIIYRTPQYFCCRTDSSPRERRVSGGRIQSFDHLARTRFASELKAEIWDTLAMGEARTWDEKIESVECPSNHVPSDIVEQENQKENSLILHL